MFKLYKIFIKAIILIMSVSLLAGCGLYRKHFGGMQEEDHLKAKEGDNLSVPSDAKITSKCKSSKRYNVPRSASSMPTDKIISDEPPGFYNK